MKRIVARGASVAAAIALVGAAVVSGPAAHALSDGLGFTADDLPTWQTNGTVWAVAAVGDTVFAGGTFSRLDPPVGGSGSPITVSALASFDATTGAPRSCRPSVTLSGGTATIRALTLAPDGRTLYIGGNFSNVGGTNVARLAALDVPTCTVRAAFRPTGISSVVRAVSVTQDAVYLGGDFTSVAGQPRGSFAAVSPTDGALLPWVADAELRGFAVAAGKDGSTVAVGGDFFTVNGQDSHGFAVVDATTGANVRNFPRGFIPDTSVIHAVTADDTGYYAGAEGTGGGVFDGSFAVDYGSFAQRWRDRCLGATQAILVDRSIVYEAHHHHDCASNNRGEFTDGVRVYLTANRADASNEMLAWRPRLNDGIGEGIGPRALTVAEAGARRYLWVGGEFTRVNGNTQQSLTRFADGPDTGAPTTPVVRAESLRTGEIRLAWRASYDDDDGALTYRVFRGSSSEPIATVTGDSRWWVRPQVSFVDTTATPGVQYTYRVTASDGTNTSPQSGGVNARAATTTQAYASAVIDDGAELYWRGELASSRYGVDSASGASQVNYMEGVTHRGGDDAATGAAGWSATFDGATGYAYDERTVPGPSVYSVETWIRTTTTRGGKIIGFGNGKPNTGTSATRLSGSYDRHVYMTNDGRLVFGTYTGSAVAVTSAQSFNDGEWHHVVATQGPTGMALYVDGKRVARNANSVAQAYEGSWRIGGDQLNGWPSRPTSNFFAGQIDETAVYPTALTGAQVESHYRATGREPAVPPAPVDAYGAAVHGLDPDLYWRLDEPSATGTVADSGRYGVTGTVTGRVALGAPGVVEPGTAATFTPVGTGAADGGTIASDVSFTDPRGYSLELWFQSSSAVGGKLIGFGNERSGLSGNYDRHVYQRDDGRLVFGVWTGTENTVVSPAAYTDGAWHHVVATHSPLTGMSLYVDGQLVGTNAATGAQSYTGYWRVGGDTSWGGTTSPWFTGSIDEVAVYGTVLTGQDVALHHALGAQLPLPDTTAPSAPAGLTATAVGDDAVALVWEAATDDVAVTGYTVRRSASPDFPAGSTTELEDVTGTSVTDAGLAAGTYYYQVLAHDAAGNVSGPGATVEITVAGPDTTAPDAPAGLTATVTGEDAVGLTWEAAQDDRAVTRYVLQRSTSPDFPPAGTTQVAEVTGTSHTDTGLDVGTYHYRVVAYDAAGNASEPGAAAEVTLLGPDVSAPGAPGGVSGSVDGAGAVSVVWSAASDDRGVAGYRVFRGVSADFVVGEGVLVGEVTGLSVVDQGRPPGEYFYKVVAFDAAGNVSEPSQVVSVTVPEPAGEPVTVVVQASGDAMVLASAASTNYGSNTQLAVRSEASAQESFLSFDLPAAPAGAGLTSAVLGVRTSTDPAAASEGEVTASVVGGSWTESGVTWANRPTGAGVVLGSLPQVPLRNTAYEVVGDPAVLASSLGGRVTLRLAGGGSDNARFWSREATNAAYAPVLTLTFTPVAAPAEAPEAAAAAADTAVGQGGAPAPSGTGGTAPGDRHAVPAVPAPAPPRPEQAPAAVPTEPVTEPEPTPGTAAGPPPAADPGTDPGVTEP
ncbi:fibronectin type 3 domain-containing protein [Cellulomonas sp. KH9]|nr:fibronectin type 3 domain-containing protein [Cellulomonas sp. KH9]